MTLNSNHLNTPVNIVDPKCLPKRNVIVIGGGPVGIRFAQELLSRSPLANVTVFGNEPSQPYNRIQLSSLLASDISYDDILIPLPNQARHPNFKYEVRTIHSINTDEKRIIDSDGEYFSYDSLVIATGSRPHVPNIEGVDQRGVYTFRNLKDTEHLYARQSRSRHVVVAGGGLLGLEAARAMARSDTKVTVIQQGERLMNRQLDDMAAQLLRSDVEALGIDIIVKEGVREIHGRDARVNGVTLRDGTHITCDTVLLCAGIKANLEIARNAKIKVGRGVLVNDRLETSAPHVYAIGECCEHRGFVYGLVNPGFEQAAIVADILCGGASQYVGSLEVSQLKVVGANVYSMGEVTELSKRPFLKQVTYYNKKEKVYRKVVIHRGKIIGSVAYGPWSESRRVQEAYQQGRHIWPWQQLRFKLSGYLWGKNAASNPQQWPATSVICQCNNITKEYLDTLIEKGAGTVASLSKQSSAGTVCGSCKPLLNALVGSNEKQEKEKAWLPALVASLIAAILVTLLGGMPALSVSDSVQNPGLLEPLWNDKFWKQVTGFTLLGLSVLGLLMSLRKRVKSTKLGHFSYWRLLHITLGLVCAGLLFLHTGLHFGANLNQLLMINFLSVLGIGALAGAITSLSHSFTPINARRLRSFFTWSHILVSWPLPILLSMHILTVYYF